MSKYYFEFEHYEDFQFPDCFGEEGIGPVERAAAVGKTITTIFGDRFVIDLTLIKGGVVYRKRLWPLNRPGSVTLVEGPLDSFTFRIGHYRGVDPDTGEEKILVGIKHLVGDGEVYKLKIDRTDNELFTLAKEGVEMFEDFSVGNDSAPSLTNAGMVEALILCSTMVIDLPSNFTEIDPDVQSYRYFLMLADYIMSVAPDIEVGFIISRIAFYKRECSNYAKMRPIDEFLPDNAISHIYNALYVSHFSENPTIVPQEIAPHLLIMFNSCFKNVQRKMTSGSNHTKRNITEDESELRKEVLKTFDSVFTPEMRAKANKDMAVFLTNCIIDMVWDINIREGSIKLFPLNIRLQINKLIESCEKSSMPKTRLSGILHDAQDEFLKDYPE